MVVSVVTALALFCGVFLSIFWTPGVLLGAFALAFAADARGLSHASTPLRRHDRMRLSTRRYRGGWLDSVARLN
jgi:hypothetical protein